MPSSFCTTRKASPFGSTAPKSISVSTQAVLHVPSCHKWTPNGAMRAAPVVTRRTGRKRPNGSGLSHVHPEHPPQTQGRSLISDGWSQTTSIRFSPSDSAAVTSTVTTSREAGLFVQTS